MHWSCSNPISFFEWRMTIRLQTFENRKMMVPPLRKLCIFGLIGNKLPRLCQYVGWVITCGRHMMGSEWLKMHQAVPVRQRSGWPHHCHLGIFLFPSPMSPRDVILLTWSHISDINLLTYFQICYCKDNIDILEDPWLVLAEICEASHVRDNLRGRKWPGRQC